MSAPGGSSRGGAPAPPDAFERGLGRLLLGATLLAAGLLGVALVWPASGAPLGTAGVVVLLAAPFGAIVLAGGLYAREGRWRAVATAGLLLAILAAGLWLQGA